MKKQPPRFSPQVHPDKGDLLGKGVKTEIPDTLVVSIGGELTIQNAQPKRETTHKETVFIKPDPPATLEYKYCKTCKEPLTFDKFQPVSSASGKVLSHDCLKCISAARVDKALKEANRQRILDSSKPEPYNASGFVAELVAEKKRLQKKIRGIDAVIKQYETK